MSEPEAQSSAWSLVREAIRGTTQNLTTIPIRRAVLLLALPTVVEMSMESLLTVVDIFFVSKLGSHAVTTVGLTESMLSIIYALAMGISAGATALVSRKIGENDREGAAVAAVQVLIAAVACATVLGAVGALYSERLLALVGADPDVVAYGAGYAKLMFGGSVTIFLLFVVNAIFRSAGDAAVAMRSLWLANTLNIILCPCLIFGFGPIPRMGVVGAAVATTISRGVGVAYQFVELGRARGHIQLTRAHLTFVRKVMGELTRIATTGTFQVLIETASWLGLVRILSVYGSDALAGYTIAMRIAVFAMLPSWGLASAAATLVGQNLGAREPDRAAASVKAIALYNMAFLGGVGIVLALVPRFVSDFFTLDPHVGAYAADCLRIVAVGFVSFSFGMVVVQAFNGAGDTVTPMLLNLGSFWFFKIPLAWFLAHVLGMGPRGVFLAVTAAYTVQAVGGGLLFRRGRWRTLSAGSA